MGIRADITPQVARIDAHSLAQPGISRLCYAGSVLHTRPASQLASRSPIMLGAELYGDSGLHADIEVISLMLETLKLAGVSGITLDLGHVGIYRRLLARSGLEADAAGAVFDALQRKSLPDLERVVAAVSDSTCRRQILELAGLHGDAAVLEQADWAEAEVAELKRVALSVAAHYPEVDLYYDLSELRGYHYHTGLVFAVYVSGHGRALANGGRYDDVGGVFGRARPATGFSTDLKALLQVLPASAVKATAIAAPDAADPALWQRIAQLRAEGEVVITSLSGEIDPRCDRQLACTDGNWEVIKLHE
jgi:ATP phosphoribosyltransferase regulatory subunit